MHTCDCFIKHLCDMPCAGASYAKPPPVCTPLDASRPDHVTTGLIGPAVPSSAADQSSNSCQPQSNTVRQEKCMCLPVLLPDHTVALHSLKSTKPFRHAICICMLSRRNDVVEMQANKSGGPDSIYAGAVQVSDAIPATKAPTDTAQMSVKQLCNIVLQSTFPYVEAIMGLLVIEVFQVWLLAALLCIHYAMKMKCSSLTYLGM